MYFAKMDKISNHGYKTIEKTSLITIRIYMKILKPLFNIVVDRFKKF